MSKEVPTASKGYFADDEDTTRRVSENMPDALKKKNRPFVNLDPVISMFLLMPREDKPDSFYMSTFMHNGLRAPRDDGDEPRKTARICLRALGEGPCAICDVYDSLKTSKVPGEVSLRNTLVPKKRVYVSVWWIPLQVCLSSPATKYEWKSQTFSGKPVKFELKLDEGVPMQPSMKVLGLPDGVWNNLKALLDRRGVEKFIGPGGMPISIIGNGVEKMGRRYKEPREEFEFPYTDLLPPDDVELIDMRTVLEVPTPMDLAKLVEFNWPGRIENLEQYAVKTAVEE